MEDVACHEAGHAVLTRVLGQEIGDVTIDPGVSGKLGYSYADVIPDRIKELPDWSQKALTEEEWQAALDDLVILLAGDVAECKLGDVPYDPGPYDDTSTDNVTVQGRLVRMCGADVKAQDALLTHVQDRARELVNDHWPQIEALASELQSRKSLTGAEAERIVDAAGINLGTDLPESEST